MPINAMCFSGIDCCKANTTKNILLIGGNAQMLWVHAAPDAAEMINDHPIWNWANVVLIRKSVRGHASPVCSETSIPKLVTRLDPNPATGFRNWNESVVESYFWWDVWVRHLQPRVGRIVLSLCSIRVGNEHA